MATKSLVTSANCEFGYLNQYGRVKIDGNHELSQAMQTVESGLPIGIDSSSIVKVYMSCEDLFRQKVYLEDQVTVIEVHSNIDESRFTEMFEKMKKWGGVENESIRVADTVILFDYFVKGRTYDKENEADFDII